MGKIYLRLPGLVAAFHRGLDRDEPLAFDTPLSFLMGSEKESALRMGLHYMGTYEQKKLGCWSQNAWGMMRRGCSPYSGERVLIRDASAPLTMAEICMLSDVKHSERMESYDYLCVEVPKEVYVAGHIVRVNGNFSLDRSAVALLRSLLQADFYHALADWLDENNWVCDELGMQRTQVDQLESFLANYHIPTSMDNHERDYMRKMISRGIGGFGYRIGGMRRRRLDFVHHVSERDKKRILSRQKANC